MSTFVYFWDVITAEQLEAILILYFFEHFFLGIGLKKAFELVKQYKNIETILEHIDQTVSNYLYKYVYKGRDRATMVISANAKDEVVHDEVKHFVDMRHVTPHEANWRINEFNFI